MIKYACNAFHAVGKSIPPMKSEVVAEQLGVLPEEVSGNSLPR